MKPPRFTIRWLMVAIAILAIVIVLWQEALFLIDRYGGLEFGVFAFLLSIILFVFSTMLSLALGQTDQAHRRPVAPDVRVPEEGP